LLDAESIWQIVRIAVPFLSGMLGAFLSAWFASRRFYSEKWWDRKYSAYSSILDALHGVQNSYQSSYDAYIEHRELSDEFEETSWKKSRAGFEELSRQRFIGDLVISQEAVNTLNTLDLELDKAAPDFFNHLYEGLGALEAATTKIRSIARSELKPASGTKPYEEK
jgi:hypothetical protein